MKLARTKTRMIGEEQTCPVPRLAVIEIQVEARGMRKMILQEEATKTQQKKVPTISEVGFIYPVRCNKRSSMIC